MSNWASFSLLHEKVTKYKTEYELEDYGDAFDWLALDAILGLGADEIEEAITDGAMDGGLDSVHIADTTVHIFNNKYTAEFDHTNKGFPETELTKILTTIDSIFSGQMNKTDVNDALWEKINEIWDGFRKGPLKFKIYLCSNKQKLNETAQKRFERSLEKHRVVEVYYLDLEDIVNKILERKYNKVDGKITFVEKQYFDRSDAGLKGVVATISAVDLVKLIQDPSDENNVIDDVFNENVRVYQPGNKINKRIRATALSETNHEFWYLNNGITIVCEKCDFVPSRSPRVTLTNFQIVNGGQTTHTLFDAYKENKEKLENVLLLVRICETRDNKISEKISETTNSQTPVNTRDLHANDEIQRKLEEEFSSLGYYYERKKNQYQYEPKELRLDNELLGQIYLAYYLDKPSEAKNTKSLIFGDYYDVIFDDKVVSSKRMLLPYKLFLPVNQMKSEIQSKKRKKLPISEKDAFVSRATFHILNVARYISEFHGLDLTDIKTIKKVVDKAISLIGDVTKTERKKRKDLYTHDKFFKETQTNSLIREYVVKQLENGHVKI
ncbi:MAG: AIPR family protein [Anaerolineales bacterium]|nr:AIPR family protein [Anaerolineales bacterium]